MAPWFAQAEQRLNIGPWLLPPNENNDLLRRGAAKLGIAARVIQRNVKGCWNLGSCGMGCPTNAKQSMLVTTIPAALDKGATLLVQTRAERFDIDGDRIVALRCVPRRRPTARVSTGATRIVAKHYVVAGGAINSPALLLRSKAPDPHGLVGKRTFLHPVVSSAALFDQAVEGWNGAPQTIYTDHFLETAAGRRPDRLQARGAADSPADLRVDAARLRRAHRRLQAQFRNTHVCLRCCATASTRNRPAAASACAATASPLLDYPLTDFVMDGARARLPEHGRNPVRRRRARGAAGARAGARLDELAAGAQCDRRAADEALVTRVVSAHVMGGCAMAGDEAQGVARPDGEHWQIDNLSVHDGSLFPTSIGANPQLSIYGLVPSWRRASRSDWRSARCSWLEVAPLALAYASTGIYPQETNVTIPALMMQQPLLISSLIVHAERHHGEQEIVSRRVEGDIHRYTYRELAHALAPHGQRARRARRQVRRPRRHAGLERLPPHGAVLRGVAARARCCTRSTRGCIPDQIVYIADHAEDQVLFFDLTFLPLVEAVAARVKTIRHFVAMTDRAHMPTRAARSPTCCATRTCSRRRTTTTSGRQFDENTASSLCYTSGTTGNPKGVLYSHRSTVLHAFAAALPDALNCSARDVILPVVPMFHVNAWGLPYVGVHGRCEAGVPGRRARRQVAVRAVRIREGHACRPACPRCGRGCSPTWRRTS